MLETLREMWAARSRALILEMARRDLKLRYKNSVGGIVWSLAAPLAQVAAITLVMKIVRPSEIRNYSAYLIGPLLLWSFMQAALSDGCVSIVNNARLVRKVYFPRAILPLATLLGNAFHFSVAFVVTILFITATGAFSDHLRPEILLVVPIVATAFVFCLGCNYILSYLTVYYEDVRFLVQAMSGLFFYALPLLYTAEDVRRALGPSFTLYMANPIASLLVCYQRALIGPPPVAGQTAPALDWPALWPYLGWSMACAVATLGVGFALFNKHQWYLAEQL